MAKESSESEGRQGGREVDSWRFAGSFLRDILSRSIPDVPSHGEIPWSPFTKPLNQAKVDSPRCSNQRRGGAKLMGGPSCPCPTDCSRFARRAHPKSGTRRPVYRHRCFPVNAAFQ